MLETDQSHDIAEPRGVVACNARGGASEFGRRLERQVRRLGRWLANLLRSTNREHDEERNQGAPATAPVNVERLCHGARPLSRDGGGARIAAVVLLLLMANAATQDRPPVPDIHFTPTRHQVADAMLELAGVTADEWCTTWAPATAAS